MPRQSHKSKSRQEIQPFNPLIALNSLPHFEAELQLDYTAHPFTLLRFASLDMAKLQSVSLLRSLPAELVSGVLKELDREDVFNVRTTCKEMSYFANPFAFKELHVWLEESSLQSLLNIASDPILCKNVRKLVIGMDYFYDITWEEFKQYIFPPFTHNPAPTQPPNLTERTQRRATWSVYREYYLKQRALENSGRDLAMMTQALKAFSSLVTVKLVDYQPCVDGFKSPQLLKTEKLLRKDMLTVPNPRIRVPRGGQQMRVLLQALAASDRKIEKLVLDLNSANISRTGFYGPLPEAFHSITIQALAGLKTLVLNLRDISPYLLKRLKLRSEESSLTSILQAATRVERLWVQFPDDFTQSWSNYIHVHRVCQLKELHISAALFHEEDFALFLRSSCQKLQKLTLWDTSVVGESWDLIFETIRNLPNLQKIELYLLWNQPDTVFKYMDAQPLYDYLLRKRNDSPWYSMCEASLEKYRREHPDSDYSEDEEADQAMMQGQA